ncbi:MAG TPA: FG-GAP-like repeat-containing protein [Candidatus Eisenbacteria bacterium]
MSRDRFALGRRTIVSARFLPLLILTALVLPAVTASQARAVPLTVTAVNPPINGVGAIYAPVRITFDRAVMTSTINGNNIRVFGKGSGAPAGGFSITEGGKVVTFTPTRAWGAGETVTVNIGTGVRSSTGDNLVAGGFAWNFRVTCAPASINYLLIDTISNRTTPVTQTRIYGAASCDFNKDGSVDLATVNEVSADIRVFLNRDDGSGLMTTPFLPPQPIGDEASPNDVGDFDNDGNPDIVAAATGTDDVWVMLGNGDGTFDITGLDVGQNPHGIVTLDLDGDADLDIAVACASSGNIWILVNNGVGNFSAVAPVDAGVTTEYGLAAGDMNRDGRIDLVVGGRDGPHIRTLLNNGNVTFTPAGPPQDSGGSTWVVTLGDLNGDGNLDATVANSFSGNGARLLNLGAGTFGPPAFSITSSHTVSTDLGDLDGDGDLDWILASYGGGFWRILRNDGAGNFTTFANITATSNPSCAIILDLDNDLDLDLALTDEIADVIQLRKNTRSSSVPTPEPGGGRVQLAPNAPNPFATSTTIRYHLAAAGSARLTLFDARGAARFERDLGAGQEGWNEVSFEAVDPTGQPLPSGIYFYEVVIGNDRARGKLTIRR